MKILHVIDSLDPAVGGPPAVATRLAAAQGNLGHDVTVLSYAEPRSQGDVNKALSAIPHIAQCRFEYIGQHCWHEAFSARSAHERLDEILPQTAVVHLHGVWDRVLLAAASAARQQDIPYVIVPSGMLDPWSLEQSKWKKKFALRLGYQKMLDCARFIHALNVDEARLIAPLGVVSPVQIFPNGVFLEEVDPLPPAGSFRRKHPQLGDRPFILFLSRLHYKKGLDYLADAFTRIAQQHPDAALVVAGPDGGAQAGFETTITAAGLSARVHVVGPLYGPDKFAAMVDATCFCLPSRQEGFSLAITEALACSLPVVISEACHFPEVATAGAGEVVELDAGAVAAGLSRVLGDAALRQRMGEAGRNLVLSRYTWPSIAREMVSAYARAGIRG